MSDSEDIVRDPKDRLTPDYWTTLESIKIPKELLQNLRAYSRRKGWSPRVVVALLLRDLLDPEMVECARQGCGCPLMDHCNFSFGQQVTGCVARVILSDDLGYVPCKCTGFIPPKTKEITPAQPTLEEYKRLLKQLLTGALSKEEKHTCSERMHELWTGLSMEEQGDASVYGHKLRESHV